MVLGEQFTLKEQVSVPLPDLFPVSHFQPSEHCLSRGNWPPIHVAAAQNYIQGKIRNNKKKKKNFNNENKTALEV